MVKALQEAEAKAVLEALDAGEGPGDFATILESIGFQDPRAAWEGLERLYRLLLGEKFTTLLPGFLDSLSRAADPDRALRNWPRFLANTFDSFSFGGRLAGTPELLDFLSRLFGFSQFLSDILIRNPEYLDWLRLPGVLDEDKPLGAYAREAAAGVALFTDPERRRHALCRYQRKELLRIGARDMLRTGTLSARVAEISDLAEAIVEVAVRERLEPLLHRFGRPRAEDGSVRESHFGIVAMGKFGGRELNFSSDVDLIFLYSAEGETEGVGGGRQGRISNHLFFTRLGEALIDYLARHGPEGFLYRVDLRLRPEGESGPLVRSLVGCETYYFTQARLWERVAFIKARMIWGEEGLRREFESMAAEFVYGQAPGPEIFGRIDEVRRRIDRQVVERGLEGREVKRGAGGIRDIEFIVGAIQIAHGHAKPDLRTRTCLETLEVIERMRLLPAADCRLLREAYTLLRDIEHRLQMTHMRQTHTLPDEPGELRALARRVGIEGALDADGFRALYRRRAAGVRRIYNAFFEQEGAAGGEAGGFGPLLDPEADPAARFEVLARHRFTDPSILSSIDSLAFGHRDAWLSEQGQRFFEAILPRFLEECSLVPLPEQAVRFFDNFLLRFKGIAATYAFIAEQPAALRILLRLFGTSETLGRILVAHPEYFDVIADPDSVAVTPPRGTFVRQAVKSATKAPSFGAAQPALCRFKDLQSLLAGVRDIEGLATPAQTAATLSDIADACVTAAMEAGARETAREEGLSSNPGALAAIAMGKLGIREMNFFSDLDLVFVHGGDPEGVADPARFYSDWAQRVIGILSGVTPAGALYKVDTRLRPEGKNAPLVAPLGRYLDYYTTRAQTWEFQSLVRSRFVAGDESLARSLREGALESMARAGRSEGIATEMREMRARIEDSVRLPSWARTDFKRSRGGVVDLEFLLQFLQLRGLSRRPGLFTPEFEKALLELREASLLGEGAVEEIRRNYRWLRALESRSRLLYATSSSYLPDKPQRLAPLEFYMRETLPAGADLTSHTVDLMEGNRRLFDAWVR